MEPEATDEIVVTYALSSDMEAVFELLKQTMTEVALLDKRISELEERIDVHIHGER